MDAQGSLFAASQDTQAIDRDPPHPEPAQPQEAPPAPLAAPCGFRNRQNLPCSRLACTPMLLDGQQLHSAGRPLSLCDLECFNGAPQTGMEPRVISIEDPEWTAHGYD